MGPRYPDDADPRLSVLEHRYSKVPIYSALWREDMSSLPAPFGDSDTLKSMEPQDFLINNAHSEAIPIHEMGVLQWPWKVGDRRIDLLFQDYTFFASLLTPAGCRISELIGRQRRLQAPPNRPKPLSVQSAVKF